MHLRFYVASIATALFFLRVPQGFAFPVLNEVMWAGSDVSTSDEWFELFLPPCDTSVASCAPENLGGYTVTYLKSTGVETLMLTFPSNFLIQPGEYLVIGNNHADSSRLLLEPAFISTSLTLANSGLRLKLKDPNGVVLDEVDDGVGVPFAGANPSAPGAKASMERIDFKVAGTIKENWRTATTSLGLDSGANMLATPGYANGTSIIPSSSSLSSSSSASSLSSSELSSSSTSSTPSSSSLISSSLSSEFSVTSSQSSDSSSSLSSSICTSDLSIDISLQSGDFSGTSKVTLNVQATAVTGTLAGATCHFDFGDGYRSDSCNPPVHSYTQSGVFSLALEVKNQCGNTLIQSKIVTVFPGAAASSSLAGVSGSPQVFDDSVIVISGVLPNPNAKDTDKEWIELTNLEDFFVPLAGWHLAVGNKTIHRYLIDTVSGIAAHDSVRLYQIETGISLSNGEDTVDLVNPQGIVISSVHWEKAEEDRIYKSDSFQDASLQGTVSSIIDPENFLISFDGPSSRLIGQSEATVRLLGISGFDDRNTTTLSAYQLQSLELVRTLTDNKKVELFFDAEVWDRDGNLLAYLVLDDGRILQKELLLQGLAIADVSTAYASRQEYIDAQKKAISLKSGIWSFVDVPQEKLNLGALTESAKVASTTGLQNFTASGSSSEILITEVFPSPSAKAESGSFLSEEWIEFLNTGAASVSLKGFTLRIGKKIITFGESSVLEPGKYTVLLVHQVGLKLKNDGDDIELLSPNKAVVASLTYPKLKLGESYAFDEEFQSYCMSKSPSAGTEASCRTQPAAAAKTTVASTKKKTVKPRASVYDKYAASYKAGLQSGDSNGTITIGSQKSESRPMPLLIFFGILLGSLGSLMALKIPRVREFVVG